MSGVGYTARSKRRKAIAASRRVRPATLNVYVDRHEKPGEVFREGGVVVSVHMERGGRRHAPHCHVRWQDGDASVRLPDLVVLDGDALPRRVRHTLLAHLDEVIERRERDNS